MSDNKTYSVIKIGEDYFMVADMALYSGIYAKENEYEIYSFMADWVLNCISQDSSHYNRAGGNGYGYKVLAATRNIGLPLIDKSLFAIPATVGLEPKSVEVSYTFMEDFSYPMKTENNYVKINKVNW